MKRALLDQLDGLVKFDLPPSMVEAEAKQIAHQLWHDEHPEVTDHNHDEIEATEEHTTLAERRVRLGLLIAEIGQKAEIEITDAEMTQRHGSSAPVPWSGTSVFEFISRTSRCNNNFAHLCSR